MQGLWLSRFDWDLLGFHKGFRGALGRIFTSEPRSGVFEKEGITSSKDGDGFGVC